jgi:hypothetical protein
MLLHDQDIPKAELDESALAQASHKPPSYDAAIFREPADLS